MSENHSEEQLPLLNPGQGPVNRRRFFRQAGMLGIGLAATGIAANSASASLPQVKPNAQSDQPLDTVAQILTAALIAEDLATTFYYNALIGKVIQDPSLAGPGGGATNVTAGGNFGNVAYVRAALTEEIAHANLLREALNIPNASADPHQTFYFPAGTFDTLAAFTGLLDALENAFIGAYLNAIQELAAKAAYLQATPPYFRNPNDPDSKYNPAELEYFAKIAASIMGVECEHRVLGRVISGSNPANNLNYETTDGITAVYNGTTSAVVALTPFLTASTGPAYSFAAALAAQGTVSQPVSGNFPTP